MPQPVDLIILGGTIITMNDRGEIFPHGAIAIAADTIAAVGPQKEILARFQPKKTLTYEEDIILPGLINAHTHAAMTCFRGLADDLPLEIWLQEHIFPAERHLSRDLVYWGTKLAVAEMLLSGTYHLLRHVPLRRRSGPGGP